MTATAVVASLPSPLSEPGGKQVTASREYVSDKLRLPKSPFLASNLKGFQFGDLEKNEWPKSSAQQFSGHQANLLWGLFFPRDITEMRQRN